MPGDLVVPIEQIDLFASKKINVTRLYPFGNDEPAAAAGQLPAFGPVRHESHVGGQRARPSA